MDDMLELIKLKIKKYKQLNGLNVLLSSVLTLVGTVSILSLLMFLYNTLGLSFFICLLLSIPLPQLYSAIINAFILDGIDNKTNKLLLEIAELEKVYELMQCPKKEVEIQSIELRFDGLSAENKLKLLNYVKDKLPLDEQDKTSFLLADEGLSLIFDGDTEKKSSERMGYSRRRVMSEEMDNKF